MTYNQTERTSRPEIAIRICEIWPSLSLENSYRTTTLTPLGMRVHFRYIDTEPYRDNPFHSLR